jgi:hypothetical protein
MEKLCEVCGNPAESRGIRKSRGKETSEYRTRFCRKHLTWFLKYGTTAAQKSSQASLEERFWRSVDKRTKDDCWEWKLSPKSNNGYGGIWDNSKKKTLLAHRVSYELSNGEIPEGKLVMHTCDNPKCVNPSHLIIGTDKENGEDKARKGRSARNIFFGEANPKSKLTLEQARYIKQHPEMKHTELATMFGLSPNCIRGVRTGRTWKDA